jgi:monoamine oxidase
MPTKEHSMIPKKQTVAVIGAGLAGLTVAHRLKEKGVDVQLYEARDRVGGRVFTVKIKDQIVELGGQNIRDGGEAENISRLMHEFDLEKIERNINFNGYYYDGSSFHSQQELIRKKKFDAKILKMQLEELSQKAKNLKEVAQALFAEDDPLYKILRVRLAAYEGGDLKDLSPLYVGTLFHILMGGICAANSPASSEGNLKRICIKGGASLLAERMGEKLADRLHKNSPLLAVSRNAGGKYALTFKNGTTSADFLVLAIPCSVYSSLAIDREVIPEDCLLAIKEVNYGKHSKILIPNCPEILKEKQFFNDRIVTFHSYYSLDHQALSFFFIGQPAFSSKKDIFEAYLQGCREIETSLGISMPQQPLLMAKDESFGNYEGPVGHCWSLDPYAQGSYSYIAAGQERILTAKVEIDDESVLKLFSPIDRRLYFAGEHTSILSEVPGTMEAACESGERTARLLLKSIA